MFYGCGFGFRCLAKGMVVCGCSVVVEWCLWVSLVFVGLFIYFYLMDRNCLYYFNGLYVKIGDMI